ncbi:MAG: phosphoribosylformylglycinamidine synthase subunit PurS [Peptococcaceae bacterium]|jgi:phosphoribosylformylglycinamidine synthase|nr:phosphoribosylformylglycinamidine synthase subunit PurS [Peptococcaceae bacterium]
MLKAQITVTLKQSILDPQGSAVEKSLRSMGYPIEAVRIGKFMEVRLAEDNVAKANEIVQEICHKLLSNPVIETYHYTLEQEHQKEVEA